MKSKRPKLRPDINERLAPYFKPEEYGPLDGDIAGKIVIMDPLVYGTKKQYLSHDYLLWKANGGFGCDPSKIGRAVFAVCYGDGESTRWDRSHFVAIYKGVIPPPPLKFADMTAAVLNHYRSLEKDALLEVLADRLGHTSYHEVQNLCLEYKLVVPPPANENKI